MKGPLSLMLKLVSVAGSGGDSTRRAGAGRFEGDGTLHPRGAECSLAPPDDRQAKVWRQLACRARPQNARRPPQEPVQSHHSRDQGSLLIHLVSFMMMYREKKQIDSVVFNKIPLMP